MKAISTPKPAPARKAAKPPKPADRPRTKAGQTQHTRALILKTGIRCLYEYGYARTSMNLISQQAGISRGPLHYHFKNPNDLMAAIAEVLPREVSQETRRRLNAAQDLDARLTTIIDIALEQHLGVHHVVVMELLMAARNDRVLAKVLRPHLLEGEEIVDQWWCDYLNLMQWPRERLLALRTISVACLRGLSLDHVLRGKAEAHSHAIDLMREMFLLIAQQAPHSISPKNGHT